MTKESVFICGDMNARVGDAQVCNEGSVFVTRKTEDKNVNKNVKNLLKICEDLNLVLLNGRIKGDETGKITYVGGNNTFQGSVIDLVLMVDGDNIQIVESLEIIDSIESDHLPVSFKISVNTKNVDRNVNRETDNNYKREKIIWDNEKAQKFRDTIREVIKNFEDEDAENYDWIKIKLSIWKAARDAGMTKWIGGERAEAPVRGYNKYTEESKEIRKEMWLFLKDWLSNKTTEKKDKLIECRKRLKKNLKEER